MRYFSPAVLVLLAACNEDETVSGYVGDSTVFTLQSINEQPFQASATIDLSETGKVSGEGPCNSYSAEQSAPYPWFNLGPVVATERACEDLSAEVTFFQSLQSMTIAEVNGPILILTNDAGREMVFDRIAAP